MVKLIDNATHSYWYLGGPRFIQIDGLWYRIVGNGHTSMAGVSCTIPNRHDLIGLAFGLIFSGLTLADSFAQNDVGTRMCVFGYCAEMMTFLEANSGNGYPLRQMTEVKNMADNIKFVSPELYQAIMRVVDLNKKNLN